MNGKQFFDEIMAIPGVINAEVTGHTPGRHIPGDPYRMPGHAEVTVNALGQHGEDIIIHIKHRDGDLAMDAAVNLATQFCTQPVL